MDLLLDTVVLSVQMVLIVYLGWGALIALSPSDRARPRAASAGETPRPAAGSPAG
jgi:hypothetical protein